MSEVDGRLIRFGGFEADLAAGELRKNGKRLPLQEQPFQILAALLDHPGEVVTREYLRERLWPGQPFVDFDQGLNTAINKLRDALGDSAANPRFVETVPRRGYRFTFPLDVSRQDVSAPTPTAGTRRWRRLWLVVGAFVLAGIGIWLWVRQPIEPQLPLRRFTLRIPVTTMDTFVFNRSMAISPDGKRIIFISEEGPNQRLWIQHLDQEQPKAIEGTEGATGPFWSPDGRVVGFALPFHGKLMRAPADGGVPATICEIPGGFFSGATWSPDGNTIVFGSGGPGVLHEVSATGGTPKVIVARDFLKTLPGVSEGSLKYLHTPHFLPTHNRRRVIVFGFGWADAQLLLRDLDTGRTEVLGPGRLPVYSATGHLIYQSTAASQDLWALPFSIDRLKATGPAFPIVRNGTDPSVAPDGTLVYTDPSSEQLTWVNRRGERTGVAGPPLSGIFYPAISPDGRNAAYEGRETENLDIWVQDLARGVRTRLSTDPATEILPAWSPDGEQVAYSSWRSGNTDIYVRRADAGAEEKTLIATPEYERVSDWLRDGSYILYSTGNFRGGDLWYLRRDTRDWKPFAFLQTPFNERVAKFSPDGKYVAYLSDESGREELYVRPFPQGDRKWAVSRNGAAQPRWSRNGKELFYVEGGTLMAVPVRTAPDFSAGAPVKLFAHAGFGHWWDPNYDVSADGERFLIPERVSGQGKQRLIHVVQNWFAEFRGQP